MSPEEALKIVSRYGPCAHDNADTRLGDGNTWARCEDCGLTFDRARWPSARRAASDFEDAVTALAKGIAQ